MIKTNQTYPFLGYAYDDGGREAAGYKGDTSDCVCRAIAIATGRPYAEVYAELREYGWRGDGKYNLNRASKWPTKRKPRKGNRRLYRAIESKIIGSDYVGLAIANGRRAKFYDGELFPARCVVKMACHLAAVVNGKVRDTWDSRYSRPYPLEELDDWLDGRKPHPEDLENAYRDEDEEDGEPIIKLPKAIFGYWPVG